MSNNLFHVIKNVISENEISALLSYFDQIKIVDSKPGYSYGMVSEVGEHIDNAEDSTYVNYLVESSNIESLLKIVYRAKEYFTTEFQLKGSLKYKRSFLNSMKDGAIVNKHSDDDDHLLELTEHESSYSALFFLTGGEEYSGGELTFSTLGGELERSIKPDAGDLVLFKGEYYHKVSPVTEGERINYIIFFKDKVSN